MVANTAGIGLVNNLITNYGAKPGDKILVSGPVGEHGLALLAERFGFKTKLKSDCGPVLKTIEKAMSAGRVTAMKDPTRGGLATCLNELAQKSKRTFFVREEDIPIRKEANSIGEVLGIDPLQTACEGRVVMCVRPKDADNVLETIKEENKRASIIGEVGKKTEGRVVVETKIGGKRFMEMPIGELYPRIC